MPDDRPEPRAEVPGAQENLVPDAALLMLLERAQVSATVRIRRRERAENE